MTAGKGEKEMFLNNADNIGYDNRESGLEAGNVQVAINELANEAYIFIEVTRSSNSEEQATKARIPYPKGFNRDNTFFVGGKYQHKGSNESEYDKLYDIVSEISYGENEIIIPSSELGIYTSSRRYWLIIKKVNLEKFKS